MAGQQEPHERERGWILKIVRSDVALGRRALARATSHWADYDQDVRQDGALRQATLNFDHENLTANH